MSQLGVIMSELSDHHFSEIGSIFTDEKGSYIVGECLSPALTWQERDSLELDRGPFREEHDYLVSLISAFTSHAKELSLENGGMVLWQLAKRLTLARMCFTTVLQGSSCLR